MRRFFEAIIVEMLYIKSDPWGYLGALLFYFGIGFGGFMLFDWILGQGYG